MAPPKALFNIIFKKKIKNDNHLYLYFYTQQARTMWISPWCLILSSSSELYVKVILKM